MSQSVPVHWNTWAYFTSGTIECFTEFALYAYIFFQHLKLGVECGISLWIHISVSENFPYVALYAIKSFFFTFSLFFKRSYTDTPYFFFAYKNCLHRHGKMLWETVNPIEFVQKKKLIFVVFFKFSSYFWLRYV